MNSRVLASFCAELIKISTASPGAPPTPSEAITLEDPIPPPSSVPKPDIRKSPMASLPRTLGKKPPQVKAPSIPQTNPNGASLPGLAPHLEPK